MNYTYTDELCHFGIKGMKWGVRRYQNYDGSYTRAGLKRYNKALNNYEFNKERYKLAKKGARKKGYTTDDGTIINVDKNVVREAKREFKESKKELKKHYKHLKQDKLADQGKELYQKNVRITSNAAVTQAIAEAAAYISVGAEMAYRYGYLDYKTARTAQAAAIGATAVSAVKGLLDEIPNRKLRAYYAHTSNY